jgi:uncharacterized damage-inducible protein DinB
MPFPKPRSICALLALACAAAAPIMAQSDIKTTVLKHLKTSREFTLKVAEQMPDASYGFKLTPPQMSFAQQLVHLSQSLSVFTAPLVGEKPDFTKPPSLDKKDVIAFIGKSFDGAIERVSKLTPAQLSKTYQSEDGSMTGTELLLAMLDHTTHHRASAEMYLRAKGITPTEYEF